MERLRSDERPEITFIIQMIEKLLNESDSLETALQQLADLDETGIEAVEKMIEQREMTIRRMLDILELLVRERTLCSEVSSGMMSLDVVKCNLVSE